MALIMYLNRAPRYDGATAKDIKLIESYYNWKRERALDGPYACNTLQEWCGVPESEMPHKYVVNYFLDFITPKKTYIEGIGEQERESIFEQMGRIAKANHIFQWFMSHVINDNDAKEYCEVTKENLESLLVTCKTVAEGFEFDGEEYSVNADLAAKMLPLMDDTGYFFGTGEYGHWYAVKVVDVIQIVENILNTTNFENQVIYFNAIW